MKTVEITNPKTWLRYRNGMCRGCYAGCCTLPLKVNTEDLFHMGFLKAQEVNGSLGPVFSRLKKLGIVKALDKKKSLFTVQTKNKHDCIFLDENRLCKIYERRPYICREFPRNSIRPGFCPKKKISEVVAGE